MVVVVWWWVVSDQLLVALLDTPAVASAFRSAGLGVDKVKKAVDKMRAGKKVESSKAEQNYEVSEHQTPPPSLSHTLLLLPHP